MDKKLDLPTRTERAKHGRNHSWTRLRLAACLTLGLAGCTYTPEDPFNITLTPSDVAGEGRIDAPQQDTAMDATQEPHPETGAPDTTSMDGQNTDGGVDSIALMDAATDNDPAMDTTPTTDVPDDTGLYLDANDDALDSSTAPETSTTDDRPEDNGPEVTVGDAGTDGSVIDYDTYDAMDSNSSDTGQPDSTSDTAESSIPLMDSSHDAPETAVIDSSMDSSDSRLPDAPNDTSTDRPADVGVDVPTGPVILRPTIPGLGTCNRVIVEGIDECLPGSASCTYHTTTRRQLRYYIEVVTVPVGAPEPTYNFQHMLREPPVAGFIRPDTGFFSPINTSGSYPIRASVVTGSIVATCYGPTITIIP